jgi:hypothetical protein
MLLLVDPTAQDDHKKLPGLEDEAHSSPMLVP